MTTFIRSLTQPFPEQLPQASVCDQRTSLVSSPSSRYTLPGCELLIICLLRCSSLKRTHIYRECDLYCSATSFISLSICLPACPSTPTPQSFIHCLQSWGPSCKPTTPFKKTRPLSQLRADADPSQGYLRSILASSQSDPSSLSSSSAFSCQQRPIDWVVLPRCRTRLSQFSLERSVNLRSRSFAHAHFILTVDDLHRIALERFDSRSPAKKQRLRNTALAPYLGFFHVSQWTLKVRGEFSMARVR